MNVWNFCAVICLVMSCLGPASKAAVDPGVSLQLTLHDVEIPQDGVVVGELLLRNVSIAPMFESYMSLNPYGGSLAFEVLGPNGAIVKCKSRIVADLVEAQELRLEPGQFVKKPICLLQYGGKHLFGEIGTYSIRAELGRDLRSPWTTVRVVRGGPGHERYLESHRFGNVFGTFILTKWAAETIDIVDTFESYSRENAKLVAFQYGARAHECLARKHVRTPEAVQEAAKGLALARRYGVGVEMWEYIADRVSNPDKLNLQPNGRLRPVNEFFF